jgi:MFS family permease
MSTSRWGRRRPFFLGGVVCGVVSLVIIGIAPSIPLVLLGWCLTQVALNAAIASLIAVLPDRVPDHKRGRVSGLMGMTNQVAQFSGVFLVQFTGTTGLVVVLVFSFYLKEVPQLRDDTPRWTWRDIPRSLWINPIKHRDFAWAFISRVLVWIGKSLLLTYKTYFLMDHLHYSTADATEILSYTMLILAIGVIVASNVSGWLSDLVKRRKIFIVAASLTFATGMVVIALSSTLSGFLIGVGIASIGQGVYVGVDYALVTSVLPNSDTEAAKGMGLFNVANTLPQSIAPAIAPLILTLSGGNYSVLYLVAAGFAILGAVAVQFVRAAR